MFTRRPGMLRKGHGSWVGDVAVEVMAFHNELCKGMDPGQTTQPYTPPSVRPPEESTGQLSDLHPSKPTAVFMMGLPAAGKSSMVQKHLGHHIGSGNMELLDADAIKKTHPDYHPERAHEIHQWSMDELRNKWADTVNQGKNFILDGTGTNTDRLVHQINKAKDAGYHTKLMHVTVPLETSLERMAKRKRKVPEQVVRDKAETIKTAFNLVSPHAHEVHVVDNSQHDPALAGKTD